MKPCFWRSVVLIDEGCSYVKEKKKMSPLLVGEEIKINNIFNKIT